MAKLILTFFGPITFLVLIILFVANCHSHAQTTTDPPKNQQSNDKVKIVGEMRDVMRRGLLHGNIDLDTIPNKQHLYGLGPVENLSGELLILDGISYRSTVLTDSTMKVEKTYQTKAPFFAYANIGKWTEQKLPDNIQTAQQLEAYLNETTKPLKKPFLFKLKGEVDKANIHVVNLPKGTKVSSPNEAHQGLVNYHLCDEEVEMVGFFSTEHKTIFTHHDTYLHLHLITADRQKMGHLDEISLKKGSATLYLPAD